MSTRYCVGISGGSASGKTSLLKDLAHLFEPGQVAVISQDNYYKPLELQPKDAQDQINYDLPECIDHAQLLKDILSLKAGHTVRRKEYVFNNPNKIPDDIIVHPSPILVVEGLFIYHWPEISNVLDLKIFIEAREDVMWARRLTRDRQERSIPEETIHYQWNEHVLPAYRNYLLPYRDEVDLVVINNKHFRQSLHVIKDHFKYILSQ